MYNVQKTTLTAEALSRMFGNKRVHVKHRLHSIEIVI
jgi:hypothetical protein